jgi:hypothetical protein
MKEKKVRTKIKKIKEPRLFATSIDMVESINEISLSLLLSDLTRLLRLSMPP